MSESLIRYASPNPIEAARRQALLWLRQAGGSAEIDLNDANPIGAACAMRVLLDLADLGFCRHEVVSETIGRFTLTGESDAHHT